MSPASHDGRGRTRGIWPWPALGMVAGLHALVLVLVVLSKFPRPPVVCAAAFLLLNGCPLILGYRLGRRLFAGAEWPVVLLVTIIFYFAYGNLLVMALGAAGYFTLPAALAASAVCQSALVFLATAVRPRVADRTAVPAGEKLSGGGLLILSLAVLVTAAMVGKNFLTTPRDFDGLTVHLPMAANMVKSGTIAPAANVPQVNRYYPVSREAVMAWVMLPFHSDNLAMVGVIEIVALMAAVYAMGREIGARRAACIATGLAFLTAPLVADQLMGSQKNDVILAVSFLAMMTFVLRFLRTGAVREAVFAGLAGGLLVGTKFSGPAYLPLVVFPILIAATGRALDGRRCAGSRRFSGRTYLRAALWFALPVILIGVPWYLRNIVLKGNPVYPVAVHVGGIELLPGRLTLDQMEVHSTSLGWSLTRLLSASRNWWKTLGIGVYLVLAAPLLAVGRLACDRGTRSFLRAYLFVLCPLYMFLVFLNHPWSASLESERYGFPFFLFGHAALLGTVAGVPALEVLWTVVAAVLAAVNMFKWTRFALPVLVAALALAASARWIAPRLSIRPVGASLARIFNLWVLAALAAAVLLGAVPWVESFRESRKPREDYGYLSFRRREERLLAEGWLHVRRNFSGTRVMAAGELRDFPLFGVRLTNELLRVPASNGVVSIPESAFVDYVLSEEAELLFCADWWVLYPERMESCPVEKWARDRPDLFAMEYENEVVSIFRVLRDGDLQHGG